MNVLDCTLRDGGYYNDWSFPSNVVDDYLTAMAAANVDIVELGLRSLKNESFKGASAFTTDDYLNSLEIPESLLVAVMVNASELVGENTDLEAVLETLFPRDADSSPVDVVRIACHVHEFEKALPATNWLKEKGYAVGFNLMQVADRSEEEVKQLSKVASGYDIDALYFADSMGSMGPEQCIKIINWLRDSWTGALGIHTHDNMGKALQNTLTAIDHGVTWLDSTVTGMGRGPGNARTEELVIELAERQNEAINMIPLMAIIRTYFQPLKNKCGWGSNPYYFLSGKYGIHPTYIQEMISIKLDEIQILEAINQLKNGEGKKYDVNLVKSEFQKPISIKKGKWSPLKRMKGREILLISSGPKLAEYQKEIEKFIIKNKLFVIAMNTSVKINKKLINMYVACNPLRLLADANPYKNIKSPIVLPASLLSKKLKKKFSNIKILDYGIGIQDNKFEFFSNCSYIPRLYNVAYALSVAASGKAKKILLAGFDGYSRQDRRLKIVDELFYLFSSAKSSIPVIAITPSNYNIAKKSIYTL